MQRVVAMSVANTVTWCHKTSEVARILNIATWAQYRQTNFLCM